MKRKRIIKLVEYQKEEETRFGIEGEGTGQWPKNYLAPLTLFYQTNLYVCKAARYILKKKK